MPVPDPTVPPGSADITLPLPISEQPPDPDPSPIPPLNPEVVPPKEP